MARLDVKEVLRAREALDEQLSPLYRALGKMFEGGEHCLTYTRTDSYPGHMSDAEAHLALHFIGHYGNRFDIHINLPYYLVSADSEFDIDCCVAAVQASPSMIYDEHDAFKNPFTHESEWPWEAS